MQNTFNVLGMTCGHCERAVTNAVQQLDANAKVQIDRAQAKVVVESAMPADKIAAAIAAEGYQVQ
ncbi:MAG: cation transporter [Comamonas sp.]|jgi:copper chaperone